MAVRVERRNQREVQFADQRQVARMLLEDRVDDDRVARARIAEQVGVRRRRRIEQLAKDQMSEDRETPSRGSGA
jgi:hypothetical protein